MNQYQYSAINVKKIFRAEVMQIVAAVLMIAALVLAIAFGGFVGLINAAAGAVGSIVVAIVVALAGVVLSIVALVNQLIGMARIGKFERAVKIAFIFLLVATIMAVANPILAAVNATAGDIAQVIQRLMEIAVTCLTIYGIQRMLSRKAGDFSVKGGNNTVIITGALLAASAVTNFVSYEVGSDAATAMSLLEYGFMLAAYIFYMVFLTRAAKQLLAAAEAPDAEGQPEKIVKEKTEGLGLIRLFQVFFAFNVLLTIASLTLINKNEISLNADVVIQVVNVVGHAVAFWLIWQRKALTRPFIMLLAGVSIVVGTGYSIYQGDLNPLMLIFSNLFSLILLLYFWLSPKAKRLMVRPFSVEIRKATAEKARNYFQPKTWGFWRNLIIYFCFFSIAGHWCEAGFCTLIRFGILQGEYDPNSQIWHDWLYPFCVYGVGACACILLFYPIKNKLLEKFKKTLPALFLSFVISALVCSGIELTMGLILNQPVNGVYPLWDYSNQFCNFMGQICLQNAVAFGLLATVITWVVYPFLEGIFEKFSDDVMQFIFVAWVVFFIILFVFYCVNLLPGADTASASAAAIAVGAASAAAFKAGATGTAVL